MKRVEIRTAKHSKVALVSIMMCDGKLDKFPAWEKDMESMQSQCAIISRPCVPIDVFFRVVFILARRRKLLLIPALHQELKGRGLVTFMKLANQSAVHVFYAHNMTMAHVIILIQNKVFYFGPYLSSIHARMTNCIFKCHQHTK